MSVCLGPNLCPIPGYRLIERLGRGGFGEVWKAEAPGGLLKAIKFVYGDLNATGDGEPAEQELKSLERVKSIRHPYILSLERFEVVDGQLLIVMELADRNLWDRYRDCRAEGLPGVPREELLSYLQEAAEALDLMNQQHQLQHLDIKPQNLFLVYNHIKIADFGLVKDFEGKRGTITGGVTPVYAAPETFEGWASRHCDQYSLAIVYQELLTGQRPFNGTTARQLLLQHLQMPPDLSSLPEADRPAIGRGLEKTPDNRFASCGELVRALKDASAGRTRVVAAPMMPRFDVPAPQNQNGSVESAPIDSEVHSPSVELGGSSILHESSESMPGQQTHVQGRPPRTHAQPFPDALPLPAPAEAAGDTDAPGVLIPAVVIGVGGVGNTVVHMLRAAIRNQFGAVNLPHLRFLAIDTDPEPLRKLAQDGETRFQPEEIISVGLNRPSHYLRSDGPVGVETWLGSSTLYKLPRMPAAAELRAFGRLAFCDHSLSLGRRLRAELAECRSEVALSSSAQITRMCVRTDKPRVYIVAGLGGGTGSGMFLDLAYLAKSICNDGEYDSIPITSVLMLPQVDRTPGRPGQATANSYAALTELAHYSSAYTRYEYRENGKSSAWIDNQPPFSRNVIFPLANPDHKEESPRLLGQASGWLLRDLLSTVGRAADRYRKPAADPAISDVAAQTASSFHFTWPADALAQRAARQMALRLLSDFTAREDPRLPEPIRGILDEQWELQKLSPEAIAEQMNDVVTQRLQCTAYEAFDDLINPLQATVDAGNRIDAHTAYRALDKIVRLIGAPPGYLVDDDRVPRIIESLNAVGAEMAQRCEKEFGDLVIRFIDLPRSRIAGAEEALRQIGDTARHTLASYESLAESLTSEANDLFKKAFTMIAGLDRFSLTAKRRDHHARDVIGQLRDFAKKKFQGVLAERLHKLYRVMINSIPEYQREVDFSRQRLDETARELNRRANASFDFDPTAGPGAPLLPAGARTVEEAAQSLVDGLTEEQWLEIDTKVQERVRGLFNSLLSFCLDSGPKPEQLADLLETVGRNYFTARLTRTNPAEAIMAHGADDDSFHELFDAAIHASHPKLVGPKAALNSMLTIIGVPDDDAGGRLAERFRSSKWDTEYVLARCRDEVVVYRELRHLNLADLPQLNATARDVYQQALVDGQNPPHSRLDIQWSAVPTS